MKNHAAVSNRLQRYMQCYGEFNVQDPVCRQICALRLRCAVEYGQQEKMELLEELFSGDDVHPRVQ